MIEYQGCPYNPMAINHTGSIGNQHHWIHIKPGDQQSSRLTRMPLENRFAQPEQYLPVEIT